MTQEEHWLEKCNEIKTFILRISGRTNTSSAEGKTEWAHALAGGLSVRGLEGSVAR